MLTSAVKIRDSDLIFIKPQQLTHLYMANGYTIDSQLFHPINIHKYVLVYFIMTKIPTWASKIALIKRSANCRVTAIEYPEATISQN